MKNRYRIAITLFILLLLSVCCLSGCQLAVYDEVTAHKSERLCGIFVTIGLDTLKLQEEQLDNAQFKINSQGKLEMQTMKPASMETEGTMSEDGQVSFGEYTGYYMGEGKIIDDNGNSHLTNISDPGFYDVKCALNENEDGKDISYEGTLNISRKSDKIIHMNPVYQRGDGSIYTVLGQSMGYSTSNSSGMVISQTLANETTSSGSSSRKKKESTSFKVNIAIMDEASQMIIKEMDSKDKLIKTTEYYPDSPEEYVVDPNTYYILVEERNNNKTDNVRRYVYNLESIELEDYYVGHTCHFQGEDYVIGVKRLHFVNKKQPKE